VSDHPTASLSDLVEIMRRLRDPQNGCEWDTAQNFATIAPYTIEEAYEVADAVARDDMDALARSSTMRAWPKRSVRSRSMTSWRQSAPR
jgi:hypothetical protein